MSKLVDSLEPRDSVQIKLVRKEVPKSEVYSHSKERHPPENLKEKAQDEKAPRKP